MMMTEASHVFLETHLLSGLQETGTEAASADDTDHRADWATSRILSDASSRRGPAKCQNGLFSEYPEVRPQR